MGLLPDITGLVLLYVTIRKPGKWIELSDIFGNDHDKISGLANPVGIDWAIDKAKSSLLFSNNNDELTLSKIISNTSRRTEELYNKFLSYNNFQLDPIEDHLNGHTPWLISDESYAHEFVYAYAKKYFPNKLLDQFNYVYFRSCPLKIKSNIISDLIAWYSTNKPVDGLYEIPGLAANPYTWDIFMGYLSTHPDLDLDKTRYKKHICSNISTKAIEYISENIETFKDCPSLYSNPSAYKLIKQLINQMDPKHADKLCSNSNPQVINLLNTYSKFISQSLSANPLDEAIDILLANPDLIDLTYLSSNSNPKIEHLLKANYGKLDKARLGSNPLIFPAKKFTPRLIEKISRIYETVVESHAEEHDKKASELRARKRIF